MSRFKSYEPRQGMFFEFYPDAHFTQGSYEHFLVNTLEQIDISCFWNKEDQGGERPYDPRSMLGIIFYAISLGIFRSRQIEKACKDNFGFMYVGGHAKPDHTTICRFITNHHEAIVKIFMIILYLAHEQGYIDYEKIAIDGTKIKANASKKFSGRMADFEKRKSKLEEKIENALKKLETATDEDERNYWKKKKERYESDKKKISDFLKEAQKEFNNRGKERIQNITDPDSRMMKMGKEFKQAYNAQAGVCGKNGFIVGADVVTDENDRNQFSNMVGQVKAAKSEKARASANKEKYLCDNGYVSKESLEYMKENDIEAYIPVTADKHAYEDTVKKKKALRVEECDVWEEEGYVKLKCPGERIFKRKKSRKDQKVYTFTAGIVSNCEGCKHFGKCRGKLKGIDKKFEVTSQYLKTADLLKKHIEKMKTDNARRIYSRRIDIVEKVFGQIKECLNIRKMLRRSIEKVKTEWMFIVCAYNMKKLHKVSVQAN